MDYSKMSDFEINKAVHLALLSSGHIKESYRLNEKDSVDVVKNTWEENDGDNSVIAIMRYSDSGGYNPFGPACDYCNNAADAWPIITENNISIILDNPTMPCATANARDLFDDADPIVSVAYDKPLRAAMLVYLQLQEAK